MIRTGIKLISYNQLYSENIKLKDKLRKRNMQIKDLKGQLSPEFGQCGSKRITLLCVENVIMK